MHKFIMIPRSWYHDPELNELFCQKASVNEPIKIRIVKGQTLLHLKRGNSSLLSAEKKHSRCTGDTFSRHTFLGIFVRRIYEQLPVTQWFSSNIALRDRSTNKNGGKYLIRGYNKTESNKFLVTLCDVFDSKDYNTF